MKRSLKDFLDLKNSRFASSDTPFFWGVEEIREVRFTILLLGLLAGVIALFMGASLLKAWWIGTGIDVGLNVVLAVVSTYQERQYRLKQDAKDGILNTLKKLQIDKTRKSDGSKTGI